MQLGRCGRVEGDWNGLSATTGPGAERFIGRVSDDFGSSDDAIRRLREELQEQRQRRRRQRPLWDLKEQKRRLAEEEEKESKEVTRRLCEEKEALKASKAEAQRLVLQIRAQAEEDMSGEPPTGGGSDGY